jgi:hypothetical protein
MVATRRGTGAATLLHELGACRGDWVGTAANGHVQRRAHLLVSRFMLTPGPTECGMT